MDPSGGGILPAETNGERGGRLPCRPRVSSTGTFTSLRRSLTLQSASTPPGVNGSGPIMASVTAGESRAARVAVRHPGSLVDTNVRLYSSMAAA